MRAILEFFPWTEVPSLGAAMAVVEATNRPECGILVDTLHYARSDSTAEQFRGVPASRFPFVHVCDAPAGTSWTREQLFHAGRVERLPPGEGGIDIKGILQNLPPDIPVGLEVPMTAMMAAKGAEAVARRVREAAERLLG
jgi:sugar phosphate isomerase/epimerase